MSMHWCGARTAFHVSISIHVFDWKDYLEQKICGSKTDSAPKKEIFKNLIRQIEKYKVY